MSTIQIQTKLTEPQPQPSPQHPRTRQPTRSKAGNSDGRCMHAQSPPSHRTIVHDDSCHQLHMIPRPRTTSQAGRCLEYSIPGYLGKGNQDRVGMQSDVNQGQGAYAHSASHRGAWGTGGREGRGVVMR